MPCFSVWIGYGCEKIQVICMAVCFKWQLDIQNPPIYKLLSVLKQIFVCKSKPQLLVFQVRNSFTLRIMKLVLKRGLPFLHFKTTSIFLNAKLWALIRESLNPSELRGWTWLGEESLDTCPFPSSKQLLQMILAQVELGWARHFSFCEYTWKTSTLVNASVTVERWFVLRLFALSSRSCGNPQKPKRGLMGAGQCICQLTHRCASWRALSVHAPCHSQPLSGSQANWDWIAALIWTLGVTLKDFPQGFPRYECDRCVSVGGQGVQVSLAREETEANMGKYVAERKRICVCRNCSSKAQPFFRPPCSPCSFPTFIATLLVSSDLPALQKRPESSVLLQILAQLCQQWQCKEILHGASCGRGSVRHAVNVGSLTGS